MNYEGFLFGIKDFSFVENPAIFNNAKEYIYENNRVKNAYHNNNHLIDVFNYSMLLFSSYFKECSLNSKDELCLGLAALFHDYNHSAGKLSDAENIEIALKELRSFLSFIGGTRLYNDIKNIIIATEFPHKDIELDILQKIIRDADTIGCVDDNWVSCVFALAEENNKKLADFIPTQITFLLDVKFNTEIFNKISERNKGNIITELELYLINNGN